MMKLTSFFSDGMILQRGQEENRIWGYTAPDAKLSLSIFSQSTIENEKEPYYLETVCADVHGYFSFLLPPMSAGGPWKIVISGEEEEKVIEDVLFGDVFLLGGQSNMELPLSFPSLRDAHREDLEKTELPMIRQFEVPKEYEFVEERHFLTAGKWMKASGEELLTFSSTGFFAAKALYERHQVPIGLYQTAVGGTPVKTWCKPETIRELGLDEEELEQCADAAYVAGTIEKETKRDQEWRMEAMQPYQEDPGEEEWHTMELPGLFDQTELQEFVGSICFKKSVYLSGDSGDADGKDAVLYLGAMIDADEILVNGVKVGETDHRYPPRIYPVPAGVLHAGENEIEVRLLVFRKGGGFMPGKAYKLVLGDGSEISLEGTWSYTVKKAMDPLEEMTFFIYKASGLYRGMLCPLQGQAFHGVFFYQGESNTWRTETYQKEFTAMVKDWRSLFQKERLPFLFVQLAGYSDGYEHTDGVSWAELREAQRKCAEIPYTGMVQAYDLGEYNDLHPVRKQEVGMRIAEAADTLIYRGNNYASGPQMTQVLRRTGEIEVQFDEELREERAEHRAVFEYGQESGEWKTVREWTCEGSTVVLQIPEQETVTQVRYAWNDCPGTGALYAKDGLPAVPFCTEVAG